MNDDTANDDTGDGTGDDPMNDGVGDSNDPIDPIDPMDAMVDPMDAGVGDSRLELLSAYLDDRVTADERARVEAEPGARAAVARLGRVREAIGRVEPPTDAARERALAAALAAAGPVEATGTATGAGRVIPFHRRFTPQRVLAVAAACLAVAVLGSVVVLSGRGDDDTSVADDAPAEAPADAATELFAMDADDAPEPERAPSDRAPGPADDADAVVPDAVVEESAEDGLDGTIAGEPAGDADAVVHVGPVDESDLAATVRDLLDDPSAHHDPDGACADTLTPVVGTGEYLGLPVLLGPDPDRAFARGADPTECTVLVEAPLTGD